MNRFDNPISDDPADDDLRFDRLVDGELSDAERRRLLASLDDEPGGWRRLAMAFLEAQAWRQAMPVETRPNDARNADGRPGFAKPTPPPNSRGTVRDKDLPAARPGFVGLVLAMAVCFLVAFLLGTEFRRCASLGPKPPAPLAQRQLPVNAEIAAAAEMTAGVVPRETNDRSPLSPVPSSPAPLSPVIPWGEATFVMDGDGGQEVDVPVFDLDPDAPVVLENSTAVMDHLRHHLQQRGFDVRRNVHFSPVEMGGGQQMVVPIGEFEIKPVSGRSIQ